MKPKHHFWLLFFYLHVTLWLNFFLTRPVIFCHGTLHNIFMFCFNWFPPQDPKWNNLNFLTLCAGRKPLVGLRGGSEIPLSPHGNDWGEYHLNHCHMENGGSKYQPTPCPAALFQHIMLRETILFSYSSNKIIPENALEMKIFFPVYVNKKGLKIFHFDTYTVL